MADPARYSGECLCGSTRYSISGSRPKAMFLCHCSRCRKETGTIHGANLFFDNARLTWERGEENCAFFNVQGTQHSRCFCKICGSPLPRVERTTHVVVPAGTLDDDRSVTPTAHIFVGSRSAWEDELVNLPRFEELPT